MIYTAGAVTLGDAKRPSADDLSDNVRGLPAALLMPERARYGTIWKVSAKASTTFFTQLYEQLHASDKDLISAFGAAQRTTRAKHRNTGTGARSI